MKKLIALLRLVWILIKPQPVVPAPLPPEEPEIEYPKLTHGGTAYAVLTCELCV